MIEPPSPFIGHLWWRLLFDKIAERTGQLTFPLNSSALGERRAHNISEHGGEKWPAELPRERGTKSTRPDEPVRNLGNRRIIAQLHSEVR